MNVLMYNIINKNRFTLFFKLAFLFIFCSLDSLLAQNLKDIDQGWPNWAYGYLENLQEGDTTAPNCLINTKKAIDCAYRGNPADNTIKYGLPDTSLEFTAYESAYDYGPADWYPQDHPIMPDIVAYGRIDDGLRACSLCHYPNGQGKMENGHVAGLPYNYIVSQLQLFADGKRKSSDPRKANTNEMSIIARSLTDREIDEAAKYFSSIPFKPLVKVIESNTAPQVRMSMNGLMLPLDKPFVQLDDYIIEVPEFPQRTAVTRDPRVGFLTYVPIGSINKGELLVLTGEGKTVPCSICHGLNLRGNGDIPGIVGKTASYTMRQLWDIKLGTRHSPEMLPTVINLNEQDLLAISAYLASLSP